MGAIRHRGKTEQINQNTSKKYLAIVEREIKQHKEEIRELENLAVIIKKKAE